MSRLFLHASNLEKVFDLGHGHAPKRAVDGISFRIEEGERVGFIGRNGAGKTTLLQLLAGIAAPTGGEIALQGRVTAIFTLGVGLRDDLTGLQNIHVESELLGRTREQTDALVDEIVAFADLGPFIDRPVRTYSTGMKARLAFSTIVHVEPEILVIDEALSVGDAKFAAKATAKMRELAASGRILILVSHSMRAIEDMCTRCIWIDGGRIRMDGPPSEVTAAYLDEVRQADEAGALARLQRELASETLLAGWSIESLEARGPEGLATLALTTGQAAALACVIRGPEGVAIEARLRLQRLDGLDVLQSSFAGASQSLTGPPGGRWDLRIDLGPLPLNFSIYRAEMQVLVDGVAAARRSILFEVLNPRPHRGGRPVLVYPTRLTATPAR